MKKAAGFRMETCERVVGVGTERRKEERKSSEVRPHSSVALDTGDQGVVGQVVKVCRYRCCGTARHCGNRDL